SWNAYPVVSLKSGSTTANIFPVAAVDAGGTVYVAWSQQDAGPGGAPAGPIRLMLSHSLDHGKTWSRPVQVNPKPIGSAVLPWIVAAGRGQVDLVYVGARTTDNPNDALATWYVYEARTGNATAATPSFTTVAAAPTPVRYGQVCVAGIDCATQGDDGRSLLDFISVDLDSHGCSYVAIPSSANQAAYPSKANMVTQTLIAKQTSGCFSATHAAAAVRTSRRRRR
ncbi:MAG TPA: sialidase family protein, partial [Acidimicrobiales bacterium]|nr:sialidase family protein [Acidimicrobiales bacterium]